MGASVESQAVTDTPEQSEIKTIRTGFHIVSANAGTGKTHTLAELIAQIYLEEESRMFPSLRQGEHVGGIDQLKILRQIIPITFTRDAANELHERVVNLLGRHGVQEPVNQWGSPHRVCRTLDSYIQSWLRRPLVIERLLRIDPDILGSMEEKFRLLPEPTQAEIRDSSSGKTNVGLFQAWSWLQKDKIAEMIFDACHRPPEDAISGVDLMVWSEEFKQWISNLPPPKTVPDGENWGTDFWPERLAIWQTYQDEVRLLSKQFQRGELANDPHFAEKYQKIKVWESHQSARKEFFSILELARSRGYHPIRSHEKLAALPVLQEIAASDNWRDFTHFHNFAIGYYAQKMRFGVMDHADFLTACVDTFEANKDLLERDREYPRLGIRGKYVLYDEVQDNSVSNNRLFRLLCAHSSIPYLGLAVGDCKQAIYGFRGACSYGFGSMIETVKTRTPTNIHHLTCSFRSLSKIVALGNECVMTLPSYKATVHPSHTVFNDPGDVVIAPPMETEQEEANWVMRKVWDILYSGTDSVMVLHRNNLPEHPIYQDVVKMEKEFSGRFRHMTIHRSKGLQAHHVFLMGMTASIMPDVRTSYTQMVNLLYVGLTRPRKALYITAPTTIKRTDSNGELTKQVAGPSPFLHDLPTLNKLAQQSGWSLADLNTGITTTKKSAAALTAKVGSKESSLRQQWRQLWPHIPIKETEGDNPTDETGGARASRTKFITRRSLYEDGVMVMDAAPRLDDGLKKRVNEKLRAAFLKNGIVPKLRNEEYVTALKLGWIVKRPSGPPDFGDPITIG